MMMRSQSPLAGVVVAVAALLLAAPAAHGADLVKMTEVSTGTGTTQLSTTITVDEYTLTLTTPTAITYKVRATVHLCHLAVQFS